MSDSDLGKKLGVTMFRWANELVPSTPDESTARLERLVEMTKRNAKPGESADQKLAAVASEMALLLAEVYFLRQVPVPGSDLYLAKIEGLFFARIQAALEKAGVFRTAEDPK